MKRKENGWREVIMEKEKKENIKIGEWKETSLSLMFIEI